MSTGSELAPRRSVARAATLGLDVSAGRRALALALVLALSAALRCYGLTRQSAWADEITTLYITDPAHSFREFWDLVLGDVHPPLYYLLMRWWSAAFGQSDLAARLPSVIFGILAVAVPATAFRPLEFPARLALMLFLAVSPGAIEYSQEARSYSLLLLLSTVITAACFRCVYLREQEDRTIARAIVVLTAAGIAASYTHYFGFLITAAADLVVIAAVPGKWRRRAAAALAFTVASVLPWIVYHAHFMSYGLRVSAWIADFPPSATLLWFLRLWVGGMPALISGAAMIALLLPLTGFRVVAARSAALGVGGALALITLATCLAISWHMPVLTSRNLIVILPALYLAMSSLVDYAVDRWSGMVVAVYVLTQLALMIEPLASYYTTRSKEQWRESAAFVLAQPGCREGPIFVYGELPNYRYFVERTRPRLKLIPIPSEGTAPATRLSASDCAVLLWAADLPRSRLDAVLSELDIVPSCVRVIAFYWAFVALREPPDANVACRSG
jgi:uncharacterized membrane protein